TASQCSTLINCTTPIVYHCPYTTLFRSGSRLGGVAAGGTARCVREGQAARAVRVDHDGLGSRVVRGRADCDVEEGGGHVGPWAMKVLERDVREDGYADPTDTGPIGIGADPTGLEWRTIGCVPAA